MTETVVHGLPRWSLAVPPLALVVLVLSWGRDLGALLLILVCAGLGAAVIAAVHHAEVVAHRVGEPFGTLILALAVTIIEVALIVTLMASGGDKAASLARDTVFAAVMITCNGILGLALVVGSLRHKTQAFRVHASGSALAVVGVVIALLVLLPETVAAVRAALRDRLQTSLNLALGSALASIGLTIPAIAVASIWLDGPLVLGLGGKELVLFALTVVVSMLTLATGRATLLQGAVHLMIFGSFLFLTVSP
jgi:Ca2+/H+ antiporter